MKKFINGLLTIAFTAGVVAFPISAPAEVHAADVQQTQVQPAGYNYIWFDNDYLTKDDWWITAPEKLTVTSNTNYTLQVKQYSLDNTNIDEVEYMILNETPGGSGNYSFRFKGNGKHVRNFTLPPGTYKVQYRSYHNTPVEIKGDLFPS